MSYIARLQAGKGVDPLDTNCYCPFPSNADPSTRCGRRGHKQCYFNLCKKCCSLLSAHYFSYDCPSPTHKESATPTKANSHKTLVRTFISLVNAAVDEGYVPPVNLPDLPPSPPPSPPLHNFTSSTTPPSSAPSFNQPPPSSPQPSPSQSPPPPPIPPPSSHQPPSYTSYHTHAGAGPSQAGEAPFNIPPPPAFSAARGTANSIDLAALAAALEALGFQRGTRVSNPPSDSAPSAHSSSSSSAPQAPPQSAHFPKNIHDALFSSPPADSSAEPWTVEEARQLLAWTVYKMGDSPTVQALRREVDLYIHLQESMPGKDTRGVLADQQAKCTDIIYRRMGYTNTWAAAEKSFLENYVDIPKHLGKPYAYLQKPPARPKDLRGSLKSYPSPPDPKSAPSKPAPSFNKPPSTCRQCSEWHWQHDCPKNSNK